MGGIGGERNAAQLGQSAPPRRRDGVQGIDRLDVGHAILRDVAADPDKTRFARQADLAPWPVVRFADLPATSVTGTASPLQPPAIPLAQWEACSASLPDARPDSRFLVEEAPPGAVPFDRLKPDAYGFWCRRLTSNPSPTSPAPNSGSELGSEVVGIGMRVTSVLDQPTK